jgi:ribosome-binding protein aMBF1 (putative translation factor)
LLDTHTIVIDAIKLGGGVNRRNWNNCSCKARFCGWQSGGVLSKDFARFFAEAMRRQRKAKGLTQETLAEKADLASKMISLIERAERNQSVNVAHSIALGLGIPLWRLVKDAEDLRRERATAKKR